MWLPKKGEERISVFTAMPQLTATFEFRETDHLGWLCSNTVSSPQQHPLKWHPFKKWAGPCYSRACYWLPFQMKGFFTGGSGKLSLLSVLFHSAFRVSNPAVVRREVSCLALPPQAAILGWHFLSQNPKAVHRLRKTGNSWPKAAVNNWPTMGCIQFLKASPPLASPRSVAVRRHLSSSSQDTRKEVLPKPSRAKPKSVAGSWALEMAALIMNISKKTFKLPDSHFKS